MARNATRIVGEIRAEPLLNAAEISRWLRITQDYVRQLAEAGILHYAKNRDNDTIKGRYTLFQTVGDYIAHLHSRRKDRPSSAAEFDAARTRRMQAIAQNAELENLMRLGLIANVQDVEQVITEQMIATRSKIMGLPLQIVNLTEGVESHEEKIKIAVGLAEQALIDCVPPTNEKIFAQNRKIARLSMEENGNGEPEEEADFDTHVKKRRRKIYDRIRKHT